MHNAPLTPQATRGYPVDPALLRIRRAERAGRRRFAALRAAAARLRRSPQR